MNKWFGIFIPFIFAFTLHGAETFFKPENVYSNCGPPEKSSEVHPREREPIQRIISLPSLPHFFLDRPELSSDLNKKFATQQNKAVSVVIIRGKKGSGKTVIARSYAKKQKEIPLIWEFNADNENNFYSSLGELALRLTNNWEDEERIFNYIDEENIQSKKSNLSTFIHEQIKTVPAWLFIFNDLQDKEVLNSFLLDDKERSGKGKILITTWQKNRWKKYKSLELLDFSEEEKLKLFQKIRQVETEIDPKKYIMNEKHEKDKKFVKKLPSSPLAIATAASYLNRTGITPEEYLKRLKRNSPLFQKLQTDMLQQ